MNISSVCGWVFLCGFFFLNDAHSFIVFPLDQRRPHVTFINKWSDCWMGFLSSLICIIKLSWLILQKALDFCTGIILPCVGGEIAASNISLTEAINLCWLFRSGKAGYSDRAINIDSWAYNFNLVLEFNLFLCADHRDCSRGREGWPLWLSYCWCEM